VVVPVQKQGKNKARKKKVLCVVPLQKQEQKQKISPLYRAFTKAKTRIKTKQSKSSV
jgi:hypothetical protein